MNYDALYERMVETVNWRKEIYRFIKRERLNECVMEVGVSKGKNLNNIVLHGDPTMTIGMDLWYKSENNPWWSQEKQDRFFASALNVRDSWIKQGKMVLILKADSHNYVHRLKNEWFDMVYIDTDHRYENTKQDLSEWHSKVKVGGLFCGHDYTHNNSRWGVVEAVDEFREKAGVKYFHQTKDNDINWLILKDKNWDIQS